MVCALQVIFVLNEQELGAVGSRSQCYASFQSPWSEQSSPHNSWEVSSLCLPLISPPETAALQAALSLSLSMPGGQESRRGLAASCPRLVYCWASGWAGNTRRAVKMRCCCSPAACRAAPRTQGRAAAGPPVLTSLWGFLTNPCCGNVCPVSKASDSLCYLWNALGKAFLLLIRV